MTNLDKQFNRWILLLRNKAEEYEHPARAKNEIIYQPDLDSICNEMEAFKNGFLAENSEEIKIK